MELQVLIFSALSIGFIHTLLGPDHYLPFIVISKARKWNTFKTLFITFICGIGHVLGSVILGILGITLGIALNLVEGIESFRGELAAWLLIGFGIAYTVWGLRIGFRSVEHTHEHEHDEHSKDHSHNHTKGHHQHSHHHLGLHAHVHGDHKKLTPWVLFIIFVLGPCEPLIPILMYPAAQGNWQDVFFVSAAFSLTTVATMMVMVFIAYKGLAKVKFDWMESYMHAIAGFIIAASGLAIKFLGL